MLQEVGALLLDELGRCFAYVAVGFEGELPGDVVGVVVGWRLQCGGPAFGRRDQLRQYFAEIAMACGVVAEVIVKVVGDGRELLHLIMDVLFATGPPLAYDLLADSVRALIEEGDEDGDALWRIVGGISKLLDLTLGESRLMLLCVRGSGAGVRKEESCEQQGRNRQGGYERTPGQ